MTTYSSFRSVLALTLMAAFLIAGAMPATASAEEVKLKLASLAPKGSSWMKTFQAINRELKKETDGEVSLKLYAGGVMGDERAMVRKMRSGQLDGAALTSVGLADINKQLLVLQLPLTFKSSKQLDYVRDQMSDTFTGLLDKQGFKLLAWGDVGFNYLFTNSPVSSPNDIKQTKCWVWDLDPVSREVMKVAGVNAVPLGVPDVLPGLNSGLVDAFLNSPYGAVALQWHTKAKYRSNLKLAVTIGGVVLTKKAWDKIPAKYHELVISIGKKHEAKLLKKIRSDNRKALKTLQDKGIEKTDISNFKKWKAIADKTRTNLTGPFFEKAIVDEMLKHLKNAP